MQLVSYFFILAIAYPVSLLPFRILYLLSDFLYLIVFYIFSYRKKVTIENLTKAFPEKSEKEIYLIAKKFFRYFCDLLLENIKLLTISKAEVYKRCKFRNLEILSELFDNKKNVIAVVGHYCNWEFGGFALALNTQHRVLAIYKPFSNTYFDELMKKLRGKFGTLLIPMEKTIRTMLAKKNELTVTVSIADQTPSDIKSCYWTNFLNQETPVFFGTEKIARKFNYPVLFFYPKKIKRGYYEIEIVPIADEPLLTKVTEITESHTKVLEKIIRENPEYWLWSHRRWKHKRS